MPLLADIQTALMSDQPIGPILLKLRFLASRLGSPVLEDWVKHESEGYPEEAELPDYRRLPVVYVGHFRNIAQAVSNYTIPPMIVANLAGEDWLTHDERQSISGIEALIEASAKNGVNPQVPRATNLAALFSNRVLSNMHCTSVVGNISRTTLSELVYVLRTRLLELTIKLETTIPGIGQLEISQANAVKIKEYANVTNNITNNIVHGNQANTNIADISAGATVQVNVQQGDSASLQSALKEMGFNQEDAADLAEIVASETPKNSNQPIGKNATAWIAKNIGKIVENVGVTSAGTLIAKAIASFYGIPI